MSLTENIKEGFFKLKISLKCILNPKDVEGLRLPPPYYIQIPRNAYFYQYMIQIDEFFNPFS